MMAVGGGGLPGRLHPLVGQGVHPLLVHSHVVGPRTDAGRETAREPLTSLVVACIDFGTPF